MKQMIHQINHYIELVGKRNFTVALFVFVMVVISGLYTTFSLSTFHESTIAVDGVRTMKFILGERDTNQTVSIAENSSKNIAITITNQEKFSLAYGIYYVSSDELSDVDIGYRHSTLHLPNGVIPSGEDYIVTIRITNHSDSIKMISFGLVYGLENGGDFELGEYQHFLKQEKSFPLNEVRKGSYVKYVGSNGCVEEQCSGKNVNSFVSNGEENNTDKGYCGKDDTSFTNDGWRVAYVNNGYPYLISAGALECVSQEEMDNSQFIKKLNDVASLYCNMDYSYRGVCDANSVWAMNGEDYYHVIGSRMSDEICVENNNDLSCGYQNDLVDIGSYYWLSSVIKTHVVYYQSHSFYSDVNDLSKGVRPIIKLSDSVVVYQGTGTQDDPYLIKNNVLPDYEYRVVYNGNGATSGDVLDSIYRSNASYQLNKNQFHLSYRVKLSDIALFDDSYCDEDEHCYESSVPDEITKEAKFLGWSVLADDMEAMYLDEEKVTNLSLSSEEIVVNLFAIWEYDAYLLPDIQKRDGYEIMGWYTEKDGGEKVGVPGDEYTGDKNVHLYARWKKQ